MPGTSPVGRRRIFGAVSLLLCLHGLAGAQPLREDYGSALARVRATINGDGTLVSSANQSGRDEVTVLLMARAGRFAELSQLLARVGATVVWQEARIGYARIRLPLDQWPAIAAAPSLQVYQFDGRSQFRHGAQERKEGYWRTRRSLPVTGDQTPPTIENLAAIIPAAARDAMREQDDALGLTIWRSRYPERDGRGVRIAQIDGGIGVWLNHPVYTAGALDRDGRRVPKIAAVVDAVSRDDLDNGDEPRPSPLVTKTFECAGTFCVFDGRGLRLPRRGAYEWNAFDLGGTLVHALNDPSTGETWVDTDGDGDFAEETRVFEYERTASWSTLKNGEPFYLSRSNPNRELRLYIQEDGHLDMGISLAAGPAPIGVAPGAQVIPIRTGTLFSARVEGAIRAVFEAQADIIVDVTPSNAYPNHAGELFAELQRRLLDTRGALWAGAAGNSSGPFETSEQPPGPALIIGGFNTPAGFRVFRLSDVATAQVESLSSRGPLSNGRLRPDIVTPMARLYGTRCSQGDKDHGDTHIPRCFAISGGTSASAPVAGGLLALLLSGRPATPEISWRRHLLDAVRFSARPLAADPVHAQGWGVPDPVAALALTQSLERQSATLELVNAPLTHKPFDASTIAPEGAYIREGWSGAQERTLSLDVRVMSEAAVRDIDIALRGDPATFRLTTPAIRAGKTGARVNVDVRTPGPGVYSALLVFTQRGTGAVIGGVPVTVVASESFTAANGYTVADKQRLPPGGEATSVWQVPENVNVLSLTFDITSGEGRMEPAESTGLSTFPARSNVAIDAGLHTAGLWTLLWPNMPSGTWGFAITSGRTEAPKVEPLSSTLRARAYGVELTSTHVNDQFQIEARNRFAAIDSAALRVTPARLTHASAEAGGDSPRPAVLDWTPARSCGTAIFSVRSARPVIGYLFDCTSGYCFLYDQFLPAARAHNLVVRKPAQGIWKLAALPLAHDGPTSVDLSIVDTTGVCDAPAYTASFDLGLDERRVVTFAAPNHEVLLAEITAPALDAEEAKHPYNAKMFQQVANRPVSLGWTVIQERSAPSTREQARRR